MNEKLKNVNLVDELIETMKEVNTELFTQQVRNGDVWKEKELTTNGISQEERFYQKILEYVTDWKDLNVPVPWVRIIADAHTALVREKKLK